MVSRGNLQVLLDERALERLLHDHGQYIDYGAKARWLALFMPEAGYLLPYWAGLAPRSLGAPEQMGGDLVYSGIAALATFIAAHSQAPDYWHKHVVTIWEIDLDGDRASVTSYFLRVHALDAGTRIVARGRYLDQVVSCTTDVDASPNGSPRSICNKA